MSREGEGSKSPLGPYAPLIVAGLGGIGIGIGGNYITPDRLDQVIERELRRQAAVIDILRDRVLEGESKVDELERFRAQGDALREYWVERLNRLEHMHAHGQHPHLQYREPPNTLPRSGP